MLTSKMINMSNVFTHQDFTSLLKILTGKVTKKYLAHFLEVLCLLAQQGGSIPGSWVFIQVFLELKVEWEDTVDIEGVYTLSGQNPL